jgi:hypothetical protein
MFPGQKWTDQQHIVITLLLWGSSLAIALNVADLGAVLELTGGVAAVSIGFHMPALLHFKMTPGLKWKFWQNPTAELKMKAIKTFARSYFIFIVGSLAMFFTITTMLGHMAAHDAGPHDAFDATEFDEYGHAIDAATAAARASTTVVPDASETIVELRRRLLGF